MSNSEKNLLGRGGVEGNTRFIIGCSWEGTKVGSGRGLCSFKTNSDFSLYSIFWFAFFGGSSNELYWTAACNGDGEHCPRLWCQNQMNEGQYQVQLRTQGILGQCKGKFPQHSFYSSLWHQNASTFCKQRHSDPPPDPSGKSQCDISTLLGKDHYGHCWLLSR